MSPGPADDEEQPESNDEHGDAEASAGERPPESREEPSTGEDAEKTAAEERGESDERPEAAGQTRDRPADDRQGDGEPEGRAAEADQPSAMDDTDADRDTEHGDRPPSEGPADGADSSTQTEGEGATADDASETAADTDRTADGEVGKVDSQESGSASNSEDGSESAANRRNEDGREGASKAADGDTAGRGSSEGEATTRVDFSSSTGSRNAEAGGPDGSASPKSIGDESDGEPDVAREGPETDEADDGAETDEPGEERETDEAGDEAGTEESDVEPSAEERLRIAERELQELQERKRDDKADDSVAAVTPSHELVEARKAYVSALQARNEELKRKLEERGEALEAAHERAERERERADERIEQKEKQIERYKERLDKKLESELKYASEDLVRGMLADVRSPLARALEQGEDIKDGVEVTLKEFDRVLEDEEDVVPIVPELGEKLNRERHEAVRTVDTDAEKNTIVEVMEPGFEMDGEIREKAAVFVAEE
ncbi:nucleotide exchange factor GrpE [Halobellus litoreus]|uniref:Protein GrpE n=1 Tax=Halobellus litoreus TaxID=755310 RepID=A0ABD6DV32_9EURY|nr:nucleotide exchange factor GrpE [Halobellus litoreus]